MTAPKSTRAARHTLAVFVLLAVLAGVLLGEFLLGPAR
jgi:hypothetical protein